MCLVHPAALTALICAIAGAASAQSTPTDMPKPEEKATGSPTLAVALVGPSREIKLSENTWFRFGAQVQAWFKAGQDRILQPDGSDGGYAFDFYCRRCRFFATGSVVKNVYFNVLFEASNLGRADAATGVKSFAPPSILDAYAQVKFTDYFWLSGGSILLPLTRNGTQPTTTYLSIDNANVDTTPILQGNTNVIRDLGFQANGFFLANHLEYRVGVFQGSRQPALPTQTASHNAPRFVTMVSANLWDTETGYVNGGHYFGAKKVLGVMGNFDYQALRTANPSLCSPPTVPCTGAGAGVSKDPYMGFSAAAFINYPLSGSPNPKGGDEIVGLLQFGYYDGGFSATNPGSYPAVLKQTNYLAEGAYYSADLKLSVFGKFEMRKISDDYAAPFKAASNVTWIAGGLKYYVAPFNLMNFGLQYERIIFNDAPSTAQGGTHNITFQMQLILY
jgi:hypothetical protein